MQTKKSQVQIPCVLLWIKASAKLIFDMTLIMTVIFPYRALLKEGFMNY